MNKAQLSYLQLSQLRHDETFNVQVTNLPTSRKITHYTLHLVSRTYRLVSTNNSLSSLVDSFATVLACGNMLNIDLPQRIFATNLHNHHEDLMPPSNPEYIKSRILHEVAVLAEACEELANLEAWDYQGVLKSTVVELCNLCLQLATAFNIDLATAVPIFLDKSPARMRFKKTTLPEGRNA